MDVKKKIKKTHVILAVFSLMLLISFINRLRYGIETSDEAYYVATGIRLFYGNVPFGDMWEVNAAESYVILPFLLIRSIFTKGNEGLFFFLRLSMLFLNFVGVAAVYTYAKQDVDKRYAYLLGLIIILFAPFHIYNFSYNSLSILFVTVSVCLTIVGIRSSKYRFFCAAGISMAFAVLVYPTMLFCGALLVGVVIILMHSKQGLKYSAIYIMGGITIAIPIIIHLLFAVGMDTVLSNLRIIMSSGSTSGMSTNGIIIKLYHAVRYLFTPFVQNGWLFCVYYCLLIIGLLVKRTRIISRYLILLYPIVCFCFSFSHGVLSEMDFVFSLALLGPLSVLGADDRKKVIGKFALEWGLSLMIYFTIAISSSGGAENAKAGLVFTAIVSMKLIIESICVTLNFQSICIFAMVSIVLVFEIILFYRYVYRDDNIQNLTEMIETGVYKGIYTTPERKRHITDLEEVLSSVEEKDESVMILYHSCYAYLMVDMKPKTPSTWGCIDVQGYGYDNQQLFMEYLNENDNIPENVLVIDIPKDYDYGGQSIDIFEPYYTDLDKFINEKYTYVGTYEKGESGKVIKYSLTQID